MVHTCLALGKTFFLKFDFGVSRGAKACDLGGPCFAGIPVVGALQGVLNVCALGMKDVLRTECCLPVHHDSFSVRLGHLGFSTGDRPNDTCLFGPVLGSLVQADRLAAAGSTIESPLLRAPLARLS